MAVDIPTRSHRSSRGSSVGSSTTYAMSKAGSKANSLGRAIRRQEREERQMKQRNSANPAAQPTFTPPPRSAAFLMPEASAAESDLTPPPPAIRAFAESPVAQKVTKVTDPSPCTPVASEPPKPAVQVPAPSPSTPVASEPPRSAAQVAELAVQAEARPTYSAAAVDSEVLRRQAVRVRSAERRGAPDIDKAGRRVPGAAGLARERSASLVGCWPGQSQRIKPEHTEREQKRFESTKQRSAHDQDLLEMLGPDFDQRREYPNMNMNAAFTDRALRLREQHSTSIGPTEPSIEPEMAPRQLAFSEAAFNNTHAFAMGPAGVASNRAPQTGPVRHLMSHDVPVSSQVDPKKNKSESAKAAIHQEDHEASHAAAEERRQLDKQIGRKAKAVDIRDMRADPSVAGNFNRDAPANRGHVKSESGQRAEMAFIVGHAVGEPAPASHVNSSRKGRGEIRTPTEFAEKMAVRENQAALRFEVCAGQEEYHGGVAGRKPQKARNPITHIGMDGDGVISLGERKQRPSTTGSQEHKSSMSFSEGVKEASAMRDLRMQQEPGFAALCEQTKQHAQSQCEEIGKLKSRNHHSRSASLADCLSWTG